MLAAEAVGRRLGRRMDTNNTPHAGAIRIFGRCRPSSWCRINKKTRNDDIRAHDSVAIRKCWRVWAPGSDRRQESSPTPTQPNPAPISSVRLARSAAMRRSASVSSRAKRDKTWPSRKGVSPELLGGRADDLRAQTL